MHHDASSTICLDTPLNADMASEIHAIREQRMQRIQARLEVIAKQYVYIGMRKLMLMTFLSIIMGSESGEHSHRLARVLHQSYLSQFTVSHPTSLN